MSEAVPRQTQFMIVDWCEVGWFRFWFGDWEDVSKGKASTHDRHNFSRECFNHVGRYWYTNHWSSNDCIRVTHNCVTLFCWDYEPWVQYLSPRNTKHPSSDYLGSSLGCGFQYCFHPLPGEMIQFDERILQMGKHSPASILQSTSNLTHHGVSHLFGTADHQPCQEYKKFQEEAAKRDHRTDDCIIFGKFYHWGCWHIVSVSIMIHTSIIFDIQF